MAVTKLVIVESPTKARTIGKMLGSEYKIMASMGHFMDLPKRAFGVDIENDFMPTYVPGDRSAQTIKDLRSAAKGMKTIYLAPDQDREGEAIAWHLQELLKPVFKGNFERVTFHEITRGAIDKAFQHTSDVDMNRVDAQQARRVLDRIVGYKVSPLLWSKVEKGVSAGRVQSVALRLICERERAILAFIPEEYWNLSVILDAPDGDKFTAKLFKIDQDKYKISDQQSAEAVLKAIQPGLPFVVTAVDAVPKLRNAPPPFTTSTLQQAANTTLKFSASGTMRVAQQLYEGMKIGTGGEVGLITYMRTDSVNIAAEAQKACREFISSAYGKEFLPGKTNYYKSKAGAQEAHEAIRPTDANRTPESMAQYLDAQQLRLYTLIWKRFVASQMAPMEQRQTTVDTDVKGKDKKVYTFRASALVTTFAGFTKVYESNKKKEVDAEDSVEANDPEADVRVLAKLKKNDRCALEEALKEQKFTEPPPRFTEASLIKELEANGIGRPSTYATILQTIQTRQYVDRDKGKLIPSTLGFKINDFLVGALPDLIEVNFTSKMESNLDEIEEGKLTWTQMLKDFYVKFAHWLDVAKHEGAPSSDKASALVAAMADIKWDKAEKRGRRSYDDGKFFNSVKEKLEESGKISAKQWEALVGMAEKYARQLPQLEKIAANFGFGDALTIRRERNQAVEQYKVDNAVTPEEQQKSVEMFNAFAKVQWEPAQKVRGRIYDDKKFFESLKSQMESGKILSEKQLQVVARFATKYQQFIPEYEKVAEILNIQAPAPAAEGTAAPTPEQNEVKAILDAMAAIETWEAPVKKGSRTFDDKTFFESLKKQSDAGKQLSPKQLFALKKMAGKYLKK